MARLDDTVRRRAVWLFLLALGVRVVAAAVIGERLHFTDEGEYVDAAARLRAGAGFDARYARVPVYPMLLAGFDAVVGGRIAGLRVLQAALTATGVVLVVQLGARTFGARAALAAGLLYALDPMLVVAGGLLYPEGVAALLVVAILLLAVDAARGRDARRAASVGIGLGVLAQLRPVALVLVAPLAAWIGLETGGSARRRAALAVAVVGGCVLALAPWTYRNYRVHGGLVPVATAGTVVPSRAQDAADADGVTASLVAQLRNHPAAFVERTARELAHFFEPFPQRLESDDPGRRAAFHAGDARIAVDPVVPRGARDVVSTLTFGPELLLAVAGVVIGLRSRRSTVLLLAGVTLCYGLGYALFVGKLRYRIPVLPAIFLLAGHAVAATRGARDGGGRR